MQEIKPIGPDAVHVCIDIQRLFAEKTDWHTASIPTILPAIARLAAAPPVSMCPAPLSRCCRKR